MDKKTTHVQTLVSMNHCVEIARRDAAYQCLLEFTERNGDVLHDTLSTKRMEVYERCRHLLQESMAATKNATLRYEPHGIMDRPAVHILKLLDAFISAMTSLATHVHMVEDAAEVLSEPLGKETFLLLRHSCTDFEKTESAARESYVRILNSEGRKLVESSSAAHRAAFSDDERRRYDLSYKEYYGLYSDENCEFSGRVRAIEHD